MKAIAVVVGLMLVMPMSRAAVFRDEGLQSLYEQGRMDDLAAAAQQRTGAEGDAARVLATLARSNASTETAVRQAEACVQQHPEVAACHFALGSALGQQAQLVGVLRGVRLVGRVKEAFGVALRLDASLFEARSALQLILLALPGFAGGSVEQAQQLEVAVRQTQPEVAKLLRARLAVQAKRWDEAERELSTLKPGADRSLQNEWLTAWAALGRHWNKLDQHARARARFEQLTRQLPHLAHPWVLLGRLAGDEGRPDEALRHFERARGLSGAELLALDYRVGIAWMDLGEREKARSHLQRFVAADRGPANNLDDARKRLQRLG